MLFYERQVGFNRNLAISIWNELQKPLAAIGAILHCIELQKQEIILLSTTANKFFKVMEEINQGASINDDEGYSELSVGTPRQPKSLPTTTVR
jgi:hypothetical protein